MKKITYLFVVITMVLSLGIGVFSDPLVATTKSDTNKRDIYLNIMTITKSQAQLVRKVSGGKHNIDYLVDVNSNVNEFKYTEDIINNVSNMDLFLYTGASFENWTNTFIDKLNKKNLGIINLARGIITKDSNPYYWIGKDEFKICLYNIKSALQDRDPQNRDFYEKNYNDIISELEKNIDEGKKLIQEASVDKDIVYVSTTNNYDYFLDSFGFNTIKVNKDNYEAIINNFINTEKKIILIVDNEEELEYDITSFEIEPIYLENNNLNKTYDQMIVDNFNIILSKISGI